MSKAQTIAKQTHRRQSEQQRLHGSPLQEYAMIGDCETVALVGRNGSIDWLCWPSFSSGACFAALLGTADHGYWKIAPVDAVSHVRRRYLPHTMVLETTYTTAGGEVQMLEFMPLRDDHSHLVRLVRGLSGKTRMHMDLVLRFDYGRQVPWVSREDHSLRAVAGPDMVVLRADVPLESAGMTTVSDFTVRSGDEVAFVMTNAQSLEKTPPAIDPREALADTVTFWTDWMRTSVYRGPHQEIVDRSLMTLKALTYRPSGGIVAAPTTSLPERLGGDRNWDYRYCWLRDTAFTLVTLLHAGFEDEAKAWRRWLLRAVAGSPDQVQALYGLNGEREAVEWVADWLPGYAHSTPVRIGNAATRQFQLDVFGEVSRALSRIPPAEEDIQVDVLSLQANLIDHLCHIWDQPDEGIWEVRGERRHFTHSKVMAWRALEAAIRQHELFDGKGDVKRWRKNRDLLRAQILEKGFNRRLNSFVQSYGSTDLDASALLFGIVGFLPADDPRMEGTVDAIERSLMKDGLVRRYDSGSAVDGLSGKEGTFLACSFWMVSQLHLMGRTGRAREMFERLLTLANDVGLFAEEYDAETGLPLGNYPQALSHLAMVQSAFTLSGLWRPERIPTT